MNASPATPSRRGLYAVNIIAAMTVCGIAAGLRLAVPEEVAGYVSNGLMLPAYRYGLLFPLVACGIILSSQPRPITRVAYLALLTAILWFGLHRAETIVLLYEPLVELILGYPVFSTAMGITTGVALLLPVRVWTWLLPIVFATCGLCVGLFIIVESPVDYYGGWFSSAAGLGCIAVVVVSTALADCVRPLCTDAAFAIAGRIFGSWLVAASLMLAALAITPERSLDSELFSIENPDGSDVTREPDAQRIFDAGNLPPVEERLIGDVMNDANGKTFLWTGQDWEPVD